MSIALNSHVNSQGGRPFPPLRFFREVFVFKMGPPKFFWVFSYKFVVQKTILGFSTFVVFDIIWVKNWKMLKFWKFWWFFPKKFWSWKIGFWEKNPLKKLFSEKSNFSISFSVTTLLNCANIFREWNYFLHTKYDLKTTERLFSNKNSWLSELRLNPKIQKISKNLKKFAKFSIFTPILRGRKSLSFVFFFFKNVGGYTNTSKVTTS